VREPSRDDINHRRSYGYYPWEAAQDLEREKLTQPTSSLPPSDEDLDAARLITLESMTPLGVPPSAKMKQRMHAMGDSTAHNATLNKGIAAYSDNVGSTLEVTPVPGLEPGLGLDVEDS
jgi:hypothetical protein